MDGCSWQGKDFFGSGILSAIYCKELRWSRMWGLLVIDKMLFAPVMISCFSDSFQKFDNKENKGKEIYSVFSQIVFWSSPIFIAGNSNFFCTLRMQLQLSGWEGAVVENLASGLCLQRACFLCRFDVFGALVVCWFSWCFLCLSFDIVVGAIMFLMVLVSLLVVA